MSRSQAATPAEFLAGLPPERRHAARAAYNLVRQHIDPGFKEVMAWGAINWVIPLSVLPDTYNGYPLGYCALGVHQSYCTLYLMSAYGDSKQYKWLEGEFRQAGKRFDMGKSCLHFKTLDDLVPEAVATVVASRTADEWVAMYRTGMASRNKAKGKRQKAEGRRKKR